MYPLSPTVIYLAKLAANSVALAVLQGDLIPLFFVLARLCRSWLHPGELLLIAVLGNLGIAAVGTLVSALATGLGRSGNLVVLLGCR